MLDYNEYLHVVLTFSFQISCISTILFADVAWLALIFYFLAFPMTLTVSKLLIIGNPLLCRCLFAIRRSSLPWILFPSIYPVPSSPQRLSCTFSVSYNTLCTVVSALLSILVRFFPLPSCHLSPDFQRLK